MKNPANFTIGRVVGFLIPELNNLNYAPQRYDFFLKKPQKVVEILKLFLTFAKIL